MNTQEHARILEVLEPVPLPPAEFPPSVIVRDTPREELMQRVRDNAASAGLEWTEEHEAVAQWLFDFYSHCCDAPGQAYTDIEDYKRYLKCLKDKNCTDDGEQSEACAHGQLSASEAINAYRVYRILLKAFADKGGKAHLYRLFPLGPIFTIHLLAQLPRLVHDVDPHFGTAY